MLLPVAVVVVTYLCLLAGIGLLALGTFWPPREPDPDLPGTSDADGVQPSASMST
jgi:hypothetical protein